MAVKFIYFDLGNVLLFFDHRRAAEQMGRVAGISTDAVWRALAKDNTICRVESGEMTDREFYERFCDATGTRPDFAELQRAGSDIFWLNWQIVPLVAQLDAAGYPLGILSNTSQSHWEFICGGQYGLLPGAFRTAVLSYEARSSKPDPGIYQAAIARAGVAPGEIFFMDDREENVAGARAAGLDAVLFTSVRQLAADLRARGVRWNY